MLERVVSGTMLALLLIGMATLTLSIQRVKVEPKTWTVDDDGPADYQTIQEAINKANEGDLILVREGIYCEKVIVNKTLSLIGENKPNTIIDANNTGNIIEITSNNVTIANFSMRNSAYLSTGVYLASVQGCKILNNYIRDTYFGVWFDSSSNNTLCGNTVTNKRYEGVREGVRLEFSSHNIISHNNVTNNFFGVELRSSSNNSIYGNRVENHVDFSFWFFCSSGNEAWQNSVINSEVGFWVFRSSDNTICKNVLERNYFSGVRVDHSSNNVVSKNNLMNNCEGIRLCFSHANGIYGNNVTSNLLGFWLEESSNDAIYHNNFVNNTDEFYVKGKSYCNVWDDGYPSGGNYWSDYVGVDVNNGSNQDLPGSDGIGDTPYVIDRNNADRYPLMKPYPWGSHDVGITSLTTSKTVVGQGYNLTISAMMFNYGNSTENVNITVHANTTVIGTFENITLTSRNSTTITLTLNTTGWDKGSYTIWAYAEPVPNETDSEDNTFTYGIITVTILGDVDGDHDVDIFDVVRVTRTYASKRGDPEYNPNSDIDDDDEITRLDIALCISHYAETYP